MVEPLRHRQTKEAATDMFDLKPLRHISTLPFASFRASHKNRSLSGAERTWMTARRWMTAT